MSGLKAALSAISERRSASERSTSPRPLPLRATSTKELRERVAEACAEPGGVGELLLQRRGVGVDADGEGGGGVVGHGVSRGLYARDPWFNEQDAALLYSDRRQGSLRMAGSRGQAPR